MYLIVGEFFITTQSHIFRQLFLTSRLLQELHVWKKQSKVTAPHFAQRSQRSLARGTKFLCTFLVIIFRSTLDSSLMRKDWSRIATSRRYDLKLTSSSQSHGESPTGGLRRQHWRPPAKRVFSRQIQIKRWKYFPRYIRRERDDAHVYAHACLRNLIRKRIIGG